MAIQYINTLQGKILDSYNNQALANLGQRIGTKGDSIIVKSFSISDILTNIPTGVNKVAISYDGTTVSCKNNISFKENDEISNTIKPIEYIGLDGTPIIENCVITNSDNNYFFKGKITQSETQSYYIAIEYTKDNQNIAVLSVSDTKTIILSTGNTNEKTFTIYQDININNFDDVNSLYDIENDLINIDGINGIGSNLATLCDYFINVLPKYFIELYNNNVYFYDNYAGLNIAILKNIIKQLCFDSKVNPSESNYFFTYLPINLVISFYTNDNSGIYYDSLPINVKFIQDNNGQDAVFPNDETIEDAMANNYIIVESAIEKAGAYKTFLEYSAIDDITIRTNKLYSIPYIGKDNYWYINDIKTDVDAIGKDAGNPNIVILQTELSDSIDNNANFINATTNTVDIDAYFASKTPKVLHTYLYEGIDIFQKTINDDAENNTLDWFSFSYNLPINSDVINNSDATMFNFTVKLPKISVLKQNIAFDSIIKNSLFFYIIDSRLSYNNSFIISEADKELVKISDARKHSLQYILTENNSEQSFITVLFSIKESSDNADGYVWKPIINDTTGAVLDLGSMIASAEFTKLFARNAYNPDNYKFSHLVFDQVNIHLKNNPTTLTSKLYPVIKNDDNTYYINSNVDNSNTNNNNSIFIPSNLNITPKFVNINTEDLGTDYLGNIEINDKEIQNKHFKITDNKISEKTQLLDNNPNDYIPNAYWSKTNNGNEVIASNVFPMFDFREVITTNQTTLNRLSLVTVASSGKVYNAYIGNSASSTEEGTLYIGSSPTNYSMAGNKTVTDDYGEFKTFNKINFELPVETNNLTIYKAGDNKYFTYINVDNNVYSQYINESPHTITSTYMGTASYKTYTFKAKEYINSAYSGFINTESIEKPVELFNVTYNEETLPSSLLFIVNFGSYDTANKCYNVSSVEQIANGASILEGIKIVPTNTGEPQSQVVVEE